MSIYASSFGSSFVYVGARSRIISHGGTRDYSGRRATIDAIDAIYIYISNTYRAFAARSVVECRTMDFSVVEQRSRVAIPLVPELDGARREKTGVDELLEIGHLCEGLGVSGDASLRGLR